MKAKLKIWINSLFATIIGVGLIFTTATFAYGQRGGKNASGSIDTAVYPYLGVESPALFESKGLDGFREWVNSNFVYPKGYEDIDINVKIVASFIVEKNGKVSNVKIVRGAGQFEPQGELLDNAVVKLIRKSPRWTPAKNSSGQALRTIIYIPVTIK